jgi:hypothetical protein
MRWVGRFFALVGIVLFVAVGALGLGMYLAVSGRDLTLLHAVVARFGSLVAGQRTERLLLDVAVDPDAGTLSGRARLTVKATEEGRRRFYFLLGDPFRLTSLAVTGYPEALAYKLWLVTVVDLGRPVPAQVPMEVVLDYEGRPAGGLFGLGTARVSPRDVQLSVDAFWFPNDLQGQFEADVAVTLPAYLTLVHAGDEVERSVRGRLQRVRWRYPRPIPSLSLVAGPYRTHDLYAGRARYRLYLADDVRLDSERVLKMAAEADDLLSQRYGPSGYPQLSLFVTRQLRRAYNDGAGVLGLSIRYFRRGDYGFNVIAHEIAHNWFGATVMERWLEPRTGGEWLVEGFAEFSSILAAETRYGREALVRRLAGIFFDPRHDAAVAAMSVLDNAVGDDGAREIIYNKGGYVVMMLRRLLGDEAFFSGVRAFLERRRYQPASEAELEGVLAETSGQDLSAFFRQWVRSDLALDLALEKPEGESGLTLQNEGKNDVVGQIAVGPAGSPEPPARIETGLGAQLPLPAAGSSLNVDPDLSWADMKRDNNVFPRARYALALASGGGGLAQVASEVYPWSPATLAARDADGALRATWELPSTVVSWPRWLDEHTVVLNTTEAAHRQPAVVLFDTRDGTSRVIGRGVGPATSAGTIYAALGDSIVRWQAPSWAREVVVRRKRRLFGAVVPSPDGARLAYAVARDNDMEIRVLTLADGRERMLVSWDRDLRELVWSADGTRIYAAIGGDWDWQVWEIAADGGPVRILMREAATLGNLALSPDGSSLAVAAAPQLDYPFNRKEIFVLDPSQRGVRRLPVEGSDVREIVWQDDNTLLAIAAPSGEAAPFTVPERRSVVRVRLSDGAVQVLE